MLSERNNNKLKEELISYNENEEPAVYLPLFSSGKERKRNTGSIAIESIGDDKWLKYDRRICRIDPKAKNIILGEEYLIKSRTRILNSKIPPLQVGKRFRFAR